MRQLVRDYQPADYAACRALWNELTDHHCVIYGDNAIGGDNPGQGFDVYLADPKRRASWVVEVQGQVVALAGLLMDGGEAEIEPVVVSESYRSRGIGTMLVRHAVEQARCLDADDVSVRPVARNGEAISFFVRLGFGLLGRVELFQSLSRANSDKWRSGISIHGHELGY